jgi:general secretion pathway protein M
MIKAIRPVLPRLNQREKVAIGIGIGFMGIFVLVNFLIYPFVENRERLERSLAVHTQNFEEIQQLRASYLEMQNRATQSKIRFERRRRGFTLFSFLEELAAQVGIKDRITSMKPNSNKLKDSPYTQSLVDMKLNGISLEQMSQFIYRIETSQNMIHIKRLSLSKKEDDKGLLNVILQVETFEV